MQLSGEVEEEYEVTVIAKVGLETTKKAEATFKLTVKSPCLDRDFVSIQAPQAGLVDQEYTLAQAAVTYEFPRFEVYPPFCAHTVNYSFEAPSELISQDVARLDKDKRMFTFKHVDDPNLSGEQFIDYVIQVLGELSKADADSASDSFVLRLVNPCLSRELVSLVAEPMQDQEYTITQ